MVPVAETGGVERGEERKEKREGVSGGGSSGDRDRRRRGREEGSEARADSGDLWPLHWPEPDAREGLREDGPPRCTDSDRG